MAALLAMPSAAGLFRRAIVQSVPNLFLTSELAADIGRAVADVIGVPPHAKELAALPPDWLIEAGDEAAAEMGAQRRWGALAHIGNPFGPVVDGEVLSRAPWTALAEGAARDVELIAGHNRDEYRLFMLLNGDLGGITSERADAALRTLAPDAEAYRAAHPHADAEELYGLVHSDWLFRMPTLRLAEAHQAGGGRTHLYELTWTSPGPAGESLRACHGLGVPLTFGNLGAGTAGTLIGREPPAGAAELSARVRAAWTAFAATGEPGWPPYDPERRDTWIIDTEPHVTPYPEETSRRLWATHPFSPLPLLPDA